MVMMMRLLFIPALLFGATQVLAQQPRFDVGLSAGPSFSWLRGNKAIDNTDPLLASAAAITLQCNLSELIGLRLGAGYQQKGSRSDVQLTDVNGNAIASGSARTKLDYLLLPLMVRARFGTGSRFTAGVGPYVGYLMRSRLSYSGEGLDGNDIDNTDDMERWDMGISASVGGSVALGGNLLLNAEVRYDKGLTNISALPVVDDGSIRTNAVCLLLGCSYRFGAAL